MEAAFSLDAPFLNFSNQYIVCMQMLAFNVCTYIESVYNQCEIRNIDGNNIKKYWPFK